MATKSTSQPDKAEGGGRLAKEPLLSFQTLAPVRPFLTVDDERHHYRLLQDFGAIEHQELTRHSEEYDELWNAEKLSRAQAKRLEWLLEWLFDRVLVNAARLREQLAVEGADTPRLSGAMKREIVLTFFNAPLLMRVMAQQEMEQDQARNGSTTES